MTFFSAAAAANLLRRVRDDAADRIVAPRYEVRSLSLWDALKTIVIVGLLLAGAIWIARWDARRDRDQWWRKEIAANSSAVRNVMAKADPAIAVSDDAVLKAIGESDVRLEQAERHVRAPIPVTSGVDCPRIKPQCL